MNARTQYTDLYLETMLPALRALTMNRYNKYPDQYSQIFQVDTSDRSIEQDTGVSGFGLLPQVAETEPLTYDSVLQGYDKTYKHVDFGLGYRVTHQMVRDDKWGLIRKMALELGRSAKITVEVEGASDFNNGFSGSFLGPDGVALFSTAHPNIGGGTQRNKPNTDIDLDVPALESALTDMRQTNDDRGKLVMIPPKKLIVPPALEFLAAEILSGTMRSDTTNNTINAFRQRSDFASFTDWMVYDYLTDQDAWFVSAAQDDISLKFFWREKFNTVSDMDFDTRAAKTGGWQAFSHGWSDWRGLWGTSGA